MESAGTCFEDRYDGGRDRPLSQTVATKRSKEGREAILRDLIRPLFSRFATTYKARLRNLIAEGDFVVAEVDGDVVTKDGGRYNNNYCFVFRFRGDKIAEVVEYADTDLEERVLGPYHDALASLG